MAGIVEDAVLVGEIGVVGREAPLVAAVGVAVGVAMVAVPAPARSQGFGGDAIIV